MKEKQQHREKKWLVCQPESFRKGINGISVWDLEQRRFTEQFWQLAVASRSVCCCAHFVLDSFGAYHKMYFALGTAIHLHVVSTFLRNGKCSTIHMERRISSFRPFYYLQTKRKLLHWITYLANIVGYLLGTLRTTDEIDEHKFFRCLVVSKRFSLTLIQALW